jgi:hypothetical protein
VGERKRLKINPKPKQISKKRKEKTKRPEKKRTYVK